MCEQEDIYSETRPLITSVLDGYNVCIMAYGQTGAGKTWTMMGPPDNPGVNRRAIKDLFAQCDAKKDTADFKISVAMTEVYNENLQDLLFKGKGENKLSIRQGPDGNFVENLTIRDVD